LGNKEFSFGIVTNWGRKLLDFESDDGDRFTVEHVVTPTFHLAVGFKAGLEFEVGASLPFGIIIGDRSPDSDNGTPNDPNDDQFYDLGGQGLGNIGLQLKTRFL